MTETPTLSIFLMWLFAAAMARAAAGSLSFAGGLAAGVAGTVCVLTRANALVFCAVLFIMLVVVRWRRQAGEDERRRLLLFVAAATLVASPLVGAWMVRNEAVVGLPTPLLGNLQRSRLLYLGQPELLVPETLAQAGVQSPPEGSANDWAYAATYGVSKAEDPEALATAIVEAHIPGLRGLYLRHVAWSIVHFFGFPAPGMVNGRRDIGFWVATFLDDPDRLREHNDLVLAGREELLPAASDRRSRGSDRLLGWWRAAGSFYLSVGRPLLVLAFLLAFCCSLWLAVRRQLSIVVQFAGVALIATAGVHAIHLADYDRFAIPFEGSQVLVLLAVVDCLGRRRHLDGPQAGGPAGRVVAEFR